MSSALLALSDGRFNHSGFNQRQLKQVIELVAHEIVPKSSEEISITFLDACNIAFSFHIIKSIRKEKATNLRLVVPFPYCFSIYSSKTFGMSIQALEICKRKGINIHYLDSNFFSSDNKDVKKFVRQERVLRYKQKSYEDIREYFENNISMLGFFCIYSHLATEGIRVNPRKTYPNFLNFGKNFLYDARQKDWVIENA